MEDVFTQFGLVRAFNAFNSYSIKDAMEKSAVFVDFVNFEAAYLVRERSQKATVGGKPCSFKVALFANHGCTAFGISKE